MQISAQDTAAYGSDIGTNLGQLLERLVKIPGDFMLRVGMMNPNSALFNQRSADKSISKPQNIPLLAYPGPIRLRQNSREAWAGDTRRRIFSELVDAFRSAYPEITIITDVIVGFPGETDEDFIADPGSHKVIAAG